MRTFLVSQERARPFGFLFNQSADGTRLDALAAENAVRIFIRQVALGNDLVVGTAVADLDGLVHLDLIAASDTAAAHDTLGEVPHDELIVVFKIIGRIRGRGKTGGGHLVTIRQGLKLAGAVGFADQAVVVARTQQQFDDHLAGRIEARGFCGNDHAGGSSRGAGRGQGPPALHLHHAHPAGSRGFGVLHITQSGNGVDARLAGNFQNGLPGIEFYSSAIQGQRRFGHGNISLHPNLG